jgi:hypothetical protein
MIFSIKINPTVLADLRHLAIVLPAAFGGIVPALITAVIISLGRLVLFGISDTSFIASIGALLIGLGCDVISKLKLNTTFKAFLMNLCGLIIVSIILGLVIGDAAVLQEILIVHYPISLIGGFLLIIYRYILLIQMNHKDN